MRKLVVFLFFLLVPSICLAQINNYGIDISLDENGEAEVKLFLTFESENQTYFNFTFPGKIEELKFFSYGKINCNPISSEKLSKVNCEFELKPDQKSILLTFKTPSLVSQIENVSYFIADFSVFKNIKEVFAVVRLPEGFGVYEKEDIIPKEETISSDGRRIIVIWRFRNVSSTTPLKFQFAYERIFPKPETFPWLNLIVFSVLIIAILIVIILFLLRRAKRSEEAFLSVLDKFEKRTLEILKENPQIKQKRLVQLLNLSKAKVSRIVKSLEERGFIEVERRGRTNLIKLKKKLSFLGKSETEKSKSENFTSFQ